ncbi:hypothetical protein T03_7221, partial [Trichinella britovi]
LLLITLPCAVFLMSMLSLHRSGTQRIQKWIDDHLCHCPSRNRNTR